MAWTDERVELVTKLWADGHSASIIASRMGGVSRNAVIGKVHRLGLSGRRTVARSKASLRNQSRGQFFGAPQNTPRLRRKYNSNSRKKTHYPNTGPATVDQKTRARELYIEAAAPTALDPPPDKRLNILALTSRTCRWPIGDPAKPGFAYCGRAKRADGKSYCDQHDAHAHGYVLE